MVRRLVTIALAGAIAAACAPAAPPPPAVTAAPAAITQPLAGKEVSVLYAGSLVNLMEKGIGPAFQKQTGASYSGQGAGSVALANALKEKTKTGDVFISADAAVNTTLMGPSNGGLVTWYVLFARTALVVGYNPRSKFAADFEKANSGAVPWYQVLQQPGLRLGRTDPGLDPKGYRSLFLFDLAEEFYKAPGLREKVLGKDTNPDQVFVEEALQTRVESGALDAGLFYLNEAAEKGLPFLTLPDEINQSNPEMAALYGKASYTNPRAQTFKGAPIIYTASVLSDAKNPAAALGFVEYLLSSPGQEIMKEHGLLSKPVLYGGDRSRVPSSIQSQAKRENKP